MTAVAVEKNLTEKRDKRAKSIAAMGLVNREADKFRVSTPSLRGKQTSYEVWRDETSKIRCNCLEFEEAAVSDAGFRCEHILAVKYALVAKNTESATKQPLKVETQIEVKPAETAAVEEDKSATESHESKRGEQKADEAQENVSDNGQSETQKFVEPSQLANTQGDKEMTQANLKETPLAIVEESADAETANNVLNFTTTLRELRKNVDPELVKQREGWRALSALARQESAAASPPTRSANRAPSARAAIQSPALARESAAPRSRNRSPPSGTTRWARA